MSKKNLEYDSKINSKKYLILDSNVQKPKAISGHKQDRLGSKTAPIETDFVNIFNNFLEF